MFTEPFIDSLLQNFQAVFGLEGSFSVQLTCLDLTLATTRERFDDYAISWHDHIVFEDKKVSHLDVLALDFFREVVIVNVVTTFDYKAATAHFFDHVGALRVDLDSHNARMPSVVGFIIWHLPFVIWEELFEHAQREYKDEQDEYRPGTTGTHHWTAYLHHENEWPEHIGNLCELDQQRDWQEGYKVVTRSFYFICRKNLLFLWTMISLKLIENVQSDVSGEMVCVLLLNFAMGRSNGFEM